MSWIEKLYATYNACARQTSHGYLALMPIGHTTQQAHIEIVLDGDGRFRRAAVLEKTASTTLIPCTEESGGRAGSKPVGHPLCDKLQYVAGDFLKLDGQVTSGFAADPAEPHRTFRKGLRTWASSAHGHPKLDAVLRYVEAGRVMSDLAKAKVLITDNDGRLLKAWDGDMNQVPPIFKALPIGQFQEDAFVRWRVEAGSDPATGTWEDAALVSAWISHYQTIQSKRGYCMVHGGEATLAVQHPAKLRHAGDKAKLISANDTAGYTFRGRFIDSDSAATVGFEVTQKAHNALRWLIARQGFRNGDQVIVSWAVSGEPLPDPFASTFELFANMASGDGPALGMADTAQAFAIRLKKAVAGYGAHLDPTAGIVVLALDSATPGRMAMTYYRELLGSEFIFRIENWHAKCAWPQNFGKDKQFIGAPAPTDIAEAAYGRRLDDKLRKAAVERLLPCIIEGSPVPLDLVLSCQRRATNRVGMERWEWEKCLGIACALIRAHHTERSYQMAMEPDRKTRDYLYGRLLAIADSIESYALSMTEESKKRETTAARLMQRFADFPFSTWRTIELSLAPYRSRLRAGSDKSGAFLAKRTRLLDEVVEALDASVDRASDAPLSGEFLLGFHSQRRAFWAGASTVDTDNDSLDESSGAETTI